jgi:translation initiation factor 1
MAKKRKGRDGLVYSTNPDYEPEYSDDSQETLLPEEQNLVVSIDRKQRKGKEVSLVDGFIGSQDDLKGLCKLVQKLCGTGGSAKDGQIIIQGNFKQKIASFLEKEGYQVKLR